MENNPVYSYMVDIYIKAKKKPNFWTYPVSLHGFQQKEHIITLVAFQPQIKLQFAVA